jgi:hypothetical protein
MAARSSSMVEVAMKASIPSKELAVPHDGQVLK